MKPAQLLLAYQRLVEKERALRESIEQIESRLASDPEVVSAEEALAEARSAQQAIAARLRDSDREREGHRTKLRTREKELMSGRIRNPTELMQMSDEVAHMKAQFAEEEDAELRLMEESEAADQALADATARLDEEKRRAGAEEPELRRSLEALEAELAVVVADRDQVWSEVPPAGQAAYSRVRVHPAVAEVDRNQCLACRVTVTSSGMQVLRKGDEMVNCDNCGRILVFA